MPGRPITDSCRQTTGPANLAARLSTPRPRVTFRELRAADLIRIEIGTRRLEESPPPTASVLRREWRFRREGWERYITHITVLVVRRMWCLEYWNAFRLVARCWSSRMAGRRDLLRRTNWMEMIATLFLLILGPLQVLRDVKGEWTRFLEISWDTLAGGGGGRGARKVWNVRKARAQTNRSHAIYGGRGNWSCVNSNEVTRSAGSYKHLENLEVVGGRGR